MGSRKDVHKELELEEDDEHVEEGLGQDEEVGSGRLAPQESRWERENGFRDDTFLKFLRTRKTTPVIGGAGYNVVSSGRLSWREVQVLKFRY